VETTGDITEDDLIKDKYFRSFVDNKNAEISLFNEKTVLHKLTHQDIYARFWIINTETSVKNSVEWKNVSNFAVPVLIDNFIKSFRK
jgi:A/G-specific adenine glycosylase